MKTISYLIQVSACTGIFYIFYHVMLKRLTFFNINRWYLIGTVVISFIIPLISIPADRIPQQYTIQSSPAEVIKMYAPIPAAEQVKATIKQAQINWISLISSLYFLVAGLLVAYLLFSLFNLYRRIQTRLTVTSGSIKIVKGSGRFKNGSFLNYIFINEQNLNPEETEQIIAHELIHVEKRHSVDKIVVRLTQVALWFNPFIYAYSHAIEANHEYEVDQEIAKRLDRSIYAELIVRLATSGGGPLCHHFSKFPLSTRISLLLNKPTRKFKKIIYVLVLPMIMVSCLVFANKQFTGDRRINVRYKSAETNFAVKDVLIKSSKSIENAISVSVKELADLKDKIQITDTPSYDSISAINGIENLGKNPLVLINGTENGPQILYKISGRGVSYGVYPPSEGTSRKFGPKAKDGVVEIKTKNGEFSLITKTEKENLIKIRSTDKSEIFSRITLKNEDGSLYEKATIRGGANTGYGSIDIPLGGKVAIFLNGKLYDESDLSEAEKILKEEIYSGVRTDDKNIEMDGVSYEGSLTFFTIKNPPPPLPRQAF